MNINRKTLIRKIFHAWFLVSRPMTLGVRVLVEDDRGHVLLVRHTYVNGWHLPGGGVEPGETQQQAVVKELREETGLEAISHPRLLGVYWNRHASRRDHVSLFRVDHWKRVEEFVPNREIAQIGFFALDDLPVGIARATRERLDEVYHSKPASHHW